MEDSIPRDINCSQCNTLIVSSNTKFCSHCGYPEHGTEKEKAKYHADRVMRKNEVLDDDERIKTATKTLFWIAGITFVSGAVNCVITKDIGVIVVSFVLALIYLVLAFWSKRKPFAALCAALFLYLTLITINTILEPVSFFSGIVFKIIIVTLLIKGLYSSSRSTKI